MRRWLFLLCLLLGCALTPTEERDARIAERLLSAARVCDVEAYAFYLKAAATLPEGQARTVLRLAEREARGWPAGEAHAGPASEAHALRVTLAAACPPEAAQARHIAGRMRSLLGASAEVSACLTGRAQASQPASLAEEALRQLEDAPREALREPGLISLTGGYAQVALRKDAQGAMVFLGSPLIPMDY